MASSAGCWRRRRAGAALAAGVAAAILGLALWMTPTAIIMEGGSDNPGPLWLQLAANLGFVAVLRRRLPRRARGVHAVCDHRRRWLDSLSANAYGMYLVHYPFVVWMQYALLDAAATCNRQGGDRVRRRGRAELGRIGRGLAQHSARRRLVGAEPRRWRKRHIFGHVRPDRSLKPACRSHPNSRSGICFTIGCD